MLDYALRHTGWSSWVRTNRRVVGRSWRRSAPAVRWAAPTSSTAAPPDGRRLVELAAGHARPGLPVDDRPLARPLALALPEAVRSRRAPQARGRAREALSPEGFRRWHLGSPCTPWAPPPRPTCASISPFRASPRAPGGDPDAAPAAGEVVEVEVEGAARRWLVLDADRPALAAPAAAGGLRRHHAALALRFVAVASRSHGAAVRLRVQDRGLYAGPPPGARLLHAADPPRRAAHRPSRRQDRSRREAPGSKAVHFEPWFAKGLAPPRASWGVVDRDRALAGVADALRSLAAFVGAVEVSVGRVAPSRLASDLRRAVRG